MLELVVGVLELELVLDDDAGRRETRETEKVCPLIVPVVTTGVPVVTVSVLPPPPNSE